MSTPAELQSFLGKLPDSTFDETKEIVRKAVLNSQKRVTARITGYPLHSRTGALRRSFQTKVAGTNFNNLTASVYSQTTAKTPVPYALVHEFGANIKAKRAYRTVPGGPYLNIPLAANKTPAGVMRQSAREVFAAGGYIAGRAVFDSAGTPMFALVKQVKIPARLGFFKIADDEARIAIDELSDRLPFAWNKL